MPVRGVQIKGLDELRHAIKESGDSGLLNALRSANESASELVVDRAMPQVPFKSGALRRSVRPAATAVMGRVKAGGGTVPYAGAIHWGRKVGNVGRPPGNRMGRNPVKGRPFIWDAAKNAERQIAFEYDKAIDQIVLGVWRSLKGD